MLLFVITDFQSKQHNLLIISQTTYSMEKQTLLNSIKRSMQVSAVQVRCSLGRTSSAATREQALKQVQMLQQAKLAQENHLY